MALRTPIIAIVGRANVGKSTLFNRLVGKRLAVVEDIPGVTRDRNYALIERFSVLMSIVDTGGFDPAGGVLEQQVAEQARSAAEEADAVIALFDAAVGLQPGDEEVVAMLRRYDKPIAFVANKCDGKEQGVRAADFYSLGLEEVVDISALNGRNVSELIESVLEQLPNYESLKASRETIQDREARAAAQAELEVDVQDSDTVDAEDQLNVESADQGTAADIEPDFAPVFDPQISSLTAVEYDRLHRVRPRRDSRGDSRQAPAPSSSAVQEEDIDNRFLKRVRVAIVGRPNVGKSTLLNTLTGETRAVTSPLAGTTRDSINVTIRRDGIDYEIVDTAGIRRRSKVDDGVERFSTLRALSAISDCDVAVVLLDAVEGPTEQDAKIVALAHDQGRGVVLAVNKWDLLEKDHRTARTYTQTVKDAFKFAPYAPILQISSLSGRRCPRVIETVNQVAHERRRWVQTSRVNQLLTDAVRRKSPAVYRGRPVKLYYASQIDSGPPRFALFFNYPREVHFSYLRYLKNTLRQEFGFVGTDIKLVTRKRGER